MSMDRERMRLYRAAVAYAKSVQPEAAADLDEAMRVCKELECAALEFAWAESRPRTFASAETP